MYAGVIIIDAIAYTLKNFHSIYFRLKVWTHSGLEFGDMLFLKHRINGHAK